MSKEIILSLDVSTVSTGWCICKGKNISDVGVIKIKDNIDIHERMLILRDSLEELIKRFNPSLLLIEDVWMGKNPKTTKTLSKFCGIAEELGFRLIRTKPIVIENTKVKKFFRCNTKQELFEFILDLLDLDSNGFSFKKDNDLIDAIAQIICYLYKTNTNIRKETTYGYLYSFGGRLKCLTTQ